MMNVSKSLNHLFTRVAPLALLLLSANLYADHQPMSISLNGSSEVPPVETSATGMGEIAVLGDRTVNGSIKVTGLDPTMAHIHEGPPGENGPSIITLTKTASDSFAVPTGARLTEAQYSSYMAGNLYVNVHSAQHPDGEIRGQLLGKPVTVATEPNQESGSKP